jgi:diaminohydroxyphosphoribosylaminopyrimidine deaminase / 5-amino-6-(5-phosphoribosylamino)uracil reductase
VSDDSDFMRVALRLARRGLGRTIPNPPVGAVLVRGGRIVGEGYHRRAGAPHAEIEAIRDAGSRARGATLYVTLEPCNHTGRTPPCCDAILAAEIGRVVFACRDPNPAVAGGGAARLRRRGVEVAGGVEESACRELLRPFATRVTTGLPLVTLKLAATLDGRIATRRGESRWISGEAARRAVHRWRDEMDAVMVGAGTILADDPLLTCRRRGGRDPLRVVVDGRLRIPVDARVLTNGLAPGTLVATGKSSGSKVLQMRRNGVQIETFPAAAGGRFKLRSLLRRLAGRGVSSVLLEGGGDLAAAALRERVVDRVACFLAPKLIGGDGRAMLGSLGVDRLGAAVELRGVRLSRVGGDFLVEGDVGGRNGR